MGRHGQADSRFEEQTLVMNIIVSGGGRIQRPVLEVHTLGKVLAPTMNVLNISHRGEKLWKQIRKSLPSRLRIVDGDW